MDDIHTQTHTCIAAGALKAQTSGRPHSQWVTRYSQREIMGEEERGLCASSPSFSGKEGQIHHCEHIDESVSLPSEGGFLSHNGPRLLLNLSFLKFMIQVKYL